MQIYKPSCTLCVGLNLITLAWWLALHSLFLFVYCLQQIWQSNLFSICVSLFPLSYHIIWKTTENVLSILLLCNFGLKGYYKIDFAQYMAILIVSTRYKYIYFWIIIRIRNVPWVAHNIIMGVNFQVCMHSHLERVNQYKIQLCNPSHFRGVKPANLGINYVAYTYRSFR